MNDFSQVRAKLRQVGDGAQEAASGCLMLRLRHFENSFAISALGLRPSAVSMWPMNGAVWDLNLILSGFSLSLCCQTL